MRRMATTVTQTESEALHDLQADTMVVSTD